MHAFLTYLQTTMNNKKHKYTKNLPMCPGMKEFRLFFNEIEIQHSHTQKKE